MAKRFTATEKRRHIRRLRKWIDRHRDMVRRILVFRDGEYCQYCGATKFLRIDHRRPLTRGGTNNFLNLQFLCEDCNQKKCNRWIDPQHIPRELHG